MIDEALCEDCGEWHPCDMVREVVVSVRLRFFKSRLCYCCRRRRGM